MSPPSPIRSSTLFTPGKSASVQEYDPALGKSTGAYPDALNEPGRLTSILLASRNWSVPFFVLFGQSRDSLLSRRTNPSKCRYKAGDTVRPTSGGPSMTDTEKYFDGEWRCTWFAGKKIRSASFRSSVLEPVPLNSPEKVGSAIDVKRNSKKEIDDKK